MSRSGLLDVVPPNEGGLQGDGDGFHGPHMRLARDMTFVFDRSSAKHLFLLGYFSPISVTIYCDLSALIKALKCLSGFFREERLWQKYLLGLAGSGNAFSPFENGELFRVAMQMHARDSIKFGDLDRLGICVYSGEHNIGLGVLYHPEYSWGKTRMLTAQMYVPDPYTEQDVLDARRVFAKNTALMLRSVAINGNPLCVHRSAIGFQEYVYDAAVLAACLERVV